MHILLCATCRSRLLVILADRPQTRSMDMLNPNSSLIIKGERDNESGTGAEIQGSNSKHRKIEGSGKLRVRRRTVFICSANRISSREVAFGQDYLLRMKVEEERLNY